MYTKHVINQQLGVAQSWNFTLQLRKGGRGKVTIVVIITMPVYYNILVYIRDNYTIYSNSVPSLQLRSAYVEVQELRRRVP